MPIAGAVAASQFFCCPVAVVVDAVAVNAITLLLIGFPQVCPSLGRGRRIRCRCCCCQFVFSLLTMAAFPLLLLITVVVLLVVICRQQQPFLGVTTAFTTERNKDFSASRNASVSAVELYNFGLMS